jgi:hypothetical protein
MLYTAGPGPAELQKVALLAAVEVETPHIKQMHATEIALIFRSTDLVAIYSLPHVLKPSNRFRPYYTRISAATSNSSPIRMSRKPF